MCSEKPQDARSEELEMLADSGSWYVAIPPSVAERLGLRKVGRERVKLADGREAEVDIVVVHVTVLGRTTHALAAVVDTPEPLLGTAVMEVLGLVVDPKTGEITAKRESSYML